MFSFLKNVGNSQGREEVVSVETDGCETASSADGTNEVSDVQSNLKSIGEYVINDTAQFISKLPTDVNIAGDETDKCSIRSAHDTESITSWTIEDGTDDDTALSLAKAHIANLENRVKLAEKSRDTAHYASLIAHRKVDQAERNLAQSRESYNDLKLNHEHKLTIQDEGFAALSDNLFKLEVSQRKTYQQYLHLISDKTELQTRLINAEAAILHEKEAKDQKIREINDQKIIIQALNRELTQKKEECQGLGQVNLRMNAKATATQAHHEKRVKIWNEMLERQRQEYDDKCEQHTQDQNATISLHKEKMDAQKILVKQVEKQIEDEKFENGLLMLAVQACEVVNGKLRAKIEELEAQVATKTESEKTSLQNIKGMYMKI